MPADRSAAPVPPTDGAGAADADRERFVFGADPARDRWWGRPLAETRWCLELGRLLADPVWHGATVTHGDGRPVVLMPGFLAGDETLRRFVADRNVAFSERSSQAAGGSGRRATSAA